MRLFFLLILLSFITSCKNSPSTNLVTIKKGDTVIEGNITDGRIFNDTILYFDLQNHLIKKAYFKNNVQEGLSTSYYTIGVTRRIETNFENGLQNGYNAYFDSSDKCFYKDFYYYNVLVGPIAYYDSIGNPTNFYFVNFENKTLLHINYRNWNGTKEFYRNYINFTSHIERHDTTHEIGLFLYVIQPPKLSFEYSIQKKKIDSGVNDYKKVRDIPNKFPFVNLELPILGNGQQYGIALDIYDSILHKSATIYQDLIVDSD